MSVIERCGLDEYFLIEPSDLHHHFRDNPFMETVVPHVVNQFSRAIAMPNLVPPVVNVSMAKDYKQRILKCVQNGMHFEPLMTLYLTDITPPEEIYEAKRDGNVVACKLYPAGATTNSDSGVADVSKIYPTLKAMEETGILLLVHGEVVDDDVDVFDREAEFIDRFLRKIVKDFPNLKVVMEHITTKEAVEFVSSCGPNVAATITCHHLLLNRNALLVGGIKPHFYCLPVLKSEYHRQALVKAAISGNPKFFLGTDSAPHTIGTKECCKGKAGCYSAINALELYAETFDAAKSMDKLNGFASIYGPLFYGLKVPPLFENAKTYQRLSPAKPGENVVPDTVVFGNSVSVPFKNGEHLKWKSKLELWKLDESSQACATINKNLWKDLLALDLKLARKKWADYAKELSQTPNAEVFELKSVVNVSENDVRLRIFTPNNVSKESGVVLFVRGGGLVFGDLETHDPICRLLAVSSNSTVIAVDYRSAPEHKYPAAHDDVYAALQWIFKNSNSQSLKFDSKKVILVGESSGCSLVLSACHKWNVEQKNAPALLGQVLWYPTVGIESGSTAALAQSAVSESKRVNLLKMYVEDFDRQNSNPYVQPIYYSSEQLQGMPSASVYVPGFDALCDQQIEFSRKLHSSGVDVQLNLLKSTIHGFAYMFGKIPVARQAIEQSGTWIQNKFSTI
jgi:dihydroorotase